MLFKLKTVRHANAISSWLDVQDANAIQALASDYGISRTVVLRTLIISALRFPAPCVQHVTARKGDDQRGGVKIVATIDDADFDLLRDFCTDADITRSAAVRLFAQQGLKQRHALHEALTLCVDDARAKAKRGEAYRALVARQGAANTKVAA